MKKQMRAAMAVVALWTGASGGGQAWATPTTYDIDPVHSGIVFFISHLGFSNVIGMAAEFSGEFVFDSETPEASTLTASVSVASISTNNKQRDSDIQGADWFNATEFPKITFVGKRFTQVDKNTGTITGDLSMVGVTKPVTMNVIFNMAGSNPWDGSKVAGFSATTTIKRSDFGMTANIPMIGDDVNLRIEVEGRGRR
ncbi:YceI family protein [Microvirga zambiensis]|uniref:YceI family protein n=1 Tax=Microvirga zambiensis TaxID=1402137 RepID=UPI00191DF393|nr:YceI family protein [Microvirga zambiensis]